MKKSLIVAMLSMLLSVNVLTPMSYAVENVGELSGIAENGGENAENGANGSSGTEGEGSYVGNTQDSSVTPQNDDNMSSGTEGEGSYEGQTGNQLDSSAEPQNDGRDTQDSSAIPQNDNQDDTANPEDLLAMPLAVPMQFVPDPDPQPEEPLADPNADPATPDEDSDDTSTQRKTTVKDLHLYFVNGSETKHYTIMDRNMGATGVNQGGYYYQWGNNWGFDYPLTDTTTYQVPYEEWFPYEENPSTFSSSKFEIGYSNWQGPNTNADRPLKFNSNQWGGKDDTILGNGPGKKSDRKGPCATGYYVPSAYDAYSLIKGWVHSSPLLDGVDDSDNNNTKGFYDEFASDLLLIIDEYISWNNGNLSSNAEGGVWTSSPVLGPDHNNRSNEYTNEGTKANNARIMWFKSTQFGSHSTIGTTQKSHGYHVRCFKNDFNPAGTTGPLTIELNGGEKTVIAVDADGHIYTLNTPSYPNDEKEFKGWYTTPNFIKGTKVEKDDNINGSTGLYARWSDVEESVIVTFENEDGTELQSGAVLSGTTLTNEAYTGATPTKEATVQYTYTFAGWTPEFAPLTDHTIYTAKFNETVNKYKVTFVDDDGTTVLKEATEYDYGTASGDIAKPADPTKKADAQYTYAFAGWSPELAEVTGNVTYKATYSSTVNKYTVTIKSNNTASGTVSTGTITVPYGTNIDTGSSLLRIGAETSTATESPDTDQYDFSFVDWTNDCGATVTTGCTITANFKSEVKKYEITWLNDDGSLIDTGLVEYGVVPTHADATKAATAEYTYTFAGWDPEVVAVTGDATYKATFSSTKNKYKVTFKDAEGNVISEKEIEYGQTPTAPSDPTKEGHTFAGWDPDILPVTGDVNYEPTFTINKHKVTWQNYDGTELEKDENVEYGTMPAYDGATPTRYADAQYTYTFAAWSPAISTVKGDIVYTATYSTTVNEYTVTFLDEDGTELYKYNVPYGMMPLYTGDIPTKEADKKYTYTFAGWTPSLAAVTGDAAYTVKFNSKKKGGKRSGGGKGGNSDPEPTHGSADDERPQDYPDTPADTPVDEPKGEIFDVHKWAYENGLTKFGDINDARMNDPITRSEMAKISSIFDTNFLGKTPDESKESECSSYPDIQNMGGDLYYFVVQSCELKNMGYNYDNENHIENFMPYNPLNVAQASVILSRMAWGKKYIIGPEKWYQGHMYAVYEHVLIDDTSDPWRFITRREAFTAFYRLDKLLKEKK